MQNKNFVLETALLIFLDIFWSFPLISDGHYNVLYNHTKLLLHHLTSTGGRGGGGNEGCSFLYQLSSFVFQRPLFLVVGHTPDDISNYFATHEHDFNQYRIEQAWRLQKKAGLSADMGIGMIMLSIRVFPIVAPPHEIIAPPPPLWYNYHVWVGGYRLSDHKAGGGYNGKDPSILFNSFPTNLQNWNLIFSPVFLGLQRKKIIVFFPFVPKTWVHTI